MLPSDKSLGYFRMSLTGHQPLPTGSSGHPTIPCFVDNASTPLLYWSPPSHSTSTAGCLCRVKPDQIENGSSTDTFARPRGTASYLAIERVNPRTSTMGAIHWLRASHRATNLPWYGDPTGPPTRSDVMICTQPQVVGQLLCRHQPHCEQSRKRRAPTKKRV